MIAAPVVPISAASGAADRHPEPAARILAEKCHEAEEAHAHAEAEWTHLEEVAAREQKPPEAEQRDWEHIGGVPDHLGERACKPRTDCAPVEAEIEDRAEDEAECEKR